MNHFNWQGLVVALAVIGAVILLLRLGLPHLFAANEAGRHLQAKHDAALAENAEKGGKPE